MNTEPPAVRVCEHGQLSRVCPHCEAAAEIERLRVEVKQAYEDGRISACHAGKPGCPRVKELEAEVAEGNRHLAQVSRIRKFHLLTKMLDHDDGEVTATMKVRRSSITKTYAAEIEALYR